MNRITPRTCLWPMIGCLLTTFALSIGLTFRSNHHCYAGTCGEWLFPFQARVHVIVWYTWISFSVLALGLRAFQPSIRNFLSLHLPLKSVPLLANRGLCVGQLILALWVCSLYAIVIGNWWVTLQDYFQDRGRDLPGNNAVAAVALTGHLADITMGMVLLPVARHSALASFFKLSANATFRFHMIQAYVLFGIVTIHATLYAAWVAAYNRDSATFRHIFPVLNPTYLYNEVWPGDRSPLGIWRASLVFTGIAASLIMVAMFFTSLPAIRRRHFNLFYFTHLLGIVAVVIICLHASTMLYCTLPGLCMWALDWGMRASELRAKIESHLCALGNGWYTLTVPLPRDRVAGCSCDSPLAHFYIHHSGSSIREIHPFTTITHLSTKEIAPKEGGGGGGCINIQFLFRKSVLGHLDQTASQPSLVKSTQWTNKLGSVADQRSLATVAESGVCEARTSLDTALNRPVDIGVQVAVRLEGPYFTPACPEAFRTVICLVAGTGLSGALAIAAAFKARRHPPALDSPIPEQGSRSSCTDAGPQHGRWQRCIVVWTVREDDCVEMPFFQDLTCDGLEFQIHKTGSGRPRPNMHQALADICGDKGDDIWCYLSGPNGFMSAMERVCCQFEGLRWYAAKWG